MSRCKWRWCKSWNTRRAMALVTLPQTSSLNPSMHRIDQFFELISPWCMQHGGFRLHYTQSFVGQQWRHHHNNCLHCAQSEQTLLWKVDRFSVSLSNFLWGTERVVRWFKGFKKYFYKDSYCLCFLICQKQPRPFHQTWHNVFRAVFILGCSLPILTK